MKRITFIRHAKVDMDSSRPIYARELAAWEEAYNTAPIVTNLLPGDELIRELRDADYVISSTLRRSIDSLKLLEVEIDECNVLFDEAAIPVLNGRFVKLRPVAWLMLFRLLSLLGIGRWANTLRESRADAKKAADRLLHLSNRHDHIVLMGHGVMNWLIRKELSKNGWERKSREMHGNWGSNELFFDKR